MLEWVDLNSTLVRCAHDEVKADCFQRDEGILNKTLFFLELYVSGSQDWSGGGFMNDVRQKGKPIQMCSKIFFSVQFYIELYIHFITVSVTSY